MNSMERKGRFKGRVWEGKEGLSVWEGKESLKESYAKERKF